MHITVILCQKGKPVHVYAMKKYGALKFISTLVQPFNHAQLKLS